MSSLADKHDLFVTGVAPGESRLEVSERVAALYHVEQERFEALLEGLVATGKPFSVKRGLSLDEAQKQKKALEAAGLMISVGDPLSLSMVEAYVPPHICPACGHEQPSAPKGQLNTCEVCGVIGEKYDHTQRIRAERMKARMDYRRDTEETPEEKARREEQEELERVRKEELERLRKLDPRVRRQRWMKIVAIVAPIVLLLIVVGGSGLFIYQRDQQQKAELRQLESLGMSLPVEGVTPTDRRLALDTGTAVNEIVAQHQQGEMTEAAEALAEQLSAVRRIEHPQFRNQGVGLVAEAQAQVGEVEDAVISAATIDDATTRMEALTRIDHINANAIEQRTPGEIQRAPSVGHERFLGAVDRVADPSLRNSVLQQLIGSELEAGRPYDALQTAQRIQEPGKRAEMLTSVAWELVAAGDRFTARDTLLTLIDTVTAHNNLEKRALHAGRLAAALAAADAEGDGKRLLRVAVTAARRIPKPESRTVMLSEIAAEQARAGEMSLANRLFDEASETLAAVASGANRDSALRALAQDLARAELFDASWRRAGDIAEASTRAFTQKALAETHMSAGRLKEATRGFGFAMSSAGVIDDANLRATLLESIGAAQLKLLERGAGNAQE